MNVLATLSFILSHPLNKCQKVGALRQFVRWQLASRLWQHRLVVPWIANTFLEVGRGEHGLTGNIYCGLYDFMEMAFLLHTLQPGDIFYDIGANAGSYTVLASGVAGARSVSIEPVPATFSRLVRNVNTNGLGDLVTALNIGIAESNGTVRFTTSHDTENRVLPGVAETAHSVLVEVKSLDGLLAYGPPNLLKIDVEGFEGAVIRGGAAVLRSSALFSVIMEVNGSGRRYGYEDESVLGMMQEFGFLPYTYEPLSRILHRTNIEPNRRSGNALFVRDEMVIRGRLCAAPLRNIRGIRF